MGNKKDLESQRQVTYQEGLEFATRNQLMFFETSAKTSENVEEAFVESTQIIYANVQRGDTYDLTNESIGIKVGNVTPVGGGAKVNVPGAPTQQPPKKRGCC